MDKSNQDLTGCSQITLSLNCKEAGDPVCIHTMYGDTEKMLSDIVWSVSCII